MKIAPWIYGRTTRWMRRLRRISLEKFIAFHSSFFVRFLSINLFFNILCMACFARSADRTTVPCKRVSRKLWEEKCGENLGGEVIRIVHE